MCASPKLGFADLFDAAEFEVRSASVVDLAKFELPLVGVARFCLAVAPFTDVTGESGLACFGDC